MGFTILPKLGCLSGSEITQTDICNTLALIWHTKAITVEKALNHLNICFKHAAALGLDVDLQAIAKEKALLEKRYSVKGLICDGLERCAGFLSDALQNNGYNITGFVFVSPYQAFAQISCVICVKIRLLKSYGHSPC